VKVPFIALIVSEPKIRANPETAEFYPYHFSGISS
jgi:hypothetical protein